MFPQTASVMPVDDVVPFKDPEGIGNKALYLLLGSRIDGYFQRAIKQFEGYGDKALAFIKCQCANISAMDKHFFHRLFTSIRIKDNESATNFLRRFTYGKAKAESASNIYTDAELVDFVLAGLYNSKSMKFDMAVQLFHLERDNGRIFTLQDIEQKFLTIDEKTSREASLSRLATGNSARTNQQNNSRYKRGNMQIPLRTQGNRGDKHIWPPAMTLTTNQ